MKKFKNILAIAACFAISLSVTSSFAADTPKKYKSLKYEVSKTEEVSTVCPVSFIEMNVVNEFNYVVFEYNGSASFEVKEGISFLFAKESLPKPNSLELNYVSRKPDKFSYDFIPSKNKIYLKNCSIRQC